jgi:Zn-dependent protease with chaperone function
MISIRGRHFDGQSAQPKEAQLTIDGSLIVQVEGAASRIEIPLTNVRISERLGNVPRRIALPDGALFETTDNDGLDALLAGANIDNEGGLVHWLESRWPIALGSLVAIALLSFLFVKFGVPALANWGAQVMPPSVDRALGAQGLEILDKALFKPSKLPAARQKVLRNKFAWMTRDIRTDGHNYRLEFRSGDAVGPNALALPSGIIVMTDDLVALAKHDEEIIAVLAHEIGHVRGRHALRQLLQTAGVSALALALLGDVSSISGLASAIPALLQAKHSRDFEREADSFAKQWLTRNNIAPERFDAILCRLNAEVGASDTDNGEPDKDTNLARDAIDYLASHPPTSERARCIPNLRKSGPVKSKN